MCRMRSSTFWCTRLVGAIRGKRAGPIWEIHCRRHCCSLPKLAVDAFSTTHRQHIWYKNYGWHRKSPGGKLSVTVWTENDELHIQVEDNGIGRKNAERLNKNENTLHKSHGMKITAERIAIVNEIYKVNTGVQITDLNDSGDNKGTRVLITIQYKTYAGNNH